jgi:uncharacterized repeat protein (TIGR03803 family)
MGHLAQHRVWTSKAGLRANHVLTFLVVLMFAALAPAQTFTTLYNFCSANGCTDGAYPVAGVIEDAAGTLYGTTFEGGSSGYGAVFKVDTAGTEAVLYSFCSQTNCADGDAPSTPLSRDWAGNIYGTTYFGGTSSNCRNGCGTVFKIDTAGNETVLHSFAGGASDGCGPYQGLRDDAGTLYGTTYGCGASGYGTIFKVDRAGNFKLLHNFSGGKSDGAYPYFGRLTMDKAGNLYGVSSRGGASGNGVLYKLSKNGTFTVLHRFGRGTDGCLPAGSVVQDKAGNFYGTTSFCGSSNYGTIWKVSKNGKETVLHNFAGGSSDGCNPAAGVSRDSKGNLYGVTYGCGANNYGVLYELSASGTFTLLHTFGGADGRVPYGEVRMTTTGTLFGTAQYGGTGHCFYGCGTLWSYVP